MEPPDPTAKIRALAAFFALLVALVPAGCTTSPLPAGPGIVAPEASGAVAPPVDTASSGKFGPSPPSFLPPSELLGDIRFEGISLEAGLSQSVVLDIEQDSRQFLWLATQDGLNRFDGYEFAIFMHEPQDPDSLSDNFVQDLVEDSRGNLWIATQSGGLDRYDRSSGGFQHLRHDPNDPNSLSSDNLLTLYEDRQGTLWVGTGNAGLNRFDPLTGEVTRFRNDPGDPGSLSGNTVQAILEDREGALWVGTFDGGLNQLDRQTGRFTHFRNDPADFTSLSDDNVQALFEDGSGTLWVGTNAGGLNRMEDDEGHFVRYQHDPNDPESLGDNNVFALHEDHLGVLWVGTSAGGLNRFLPERGAFLRFQQEADDPQSLSNDNVQSIFEDRSGILWIGTFGGGVNKYDRSQRRFAHYRHDPTDSRSLSSNLVWTFAEDQEGQIWIGTIGGGLNRFDRTTNQFTHYLSDPDDSNSLAHDFVWFLLSDQAGNLWIGTDAGLDRLDPQRRRFTLYDTDPIFSIVEDRSGILWLGSGGGGLGRLDPQTDALTWVQHVTGDPSSLSDDFITCLLLDRDGRLWAGTFGNGLNQLLSPEAADPGNTQAPARFARYQHDPDDPTSLAHNTVIALYQDRAGALWVGTASGLDRMDSAGSSFTHYGQKDGLPNEVIYGILEDDAGHLWLSTNRGLSRFNPQTGTFRNYDPGDGLQSNEFNQSAAYRLRSGEMLFGGINGFNLFDPGHVQDNTDPPPVVMTGFRLFNEPVTAGAGSVLQQPIDETQEIELSYQDDFFSFEFAALDYSDPAENQYAYFMEGLERDWNYVDQIRFANYTSVPPGSYTFRVKASNSDGVWNENGSAIRITITPPFWDTWWFRGLATVLVVGTMAGAVAWRIRYLDGQRRRLEILVEERTRALSQTMEELTQAKEAAEGANRAKSAFLANMSHELRTPLNAIMGFTQLMDRDSNLTPAQQENLAIVNRSGEHLLGLINDVLEMSKIEAGRTTLSSRDFDLRHLLNSLEEMFRLRARQKGLMLEVDVAPDVPQCVHMDEGKLRQVLMNLLGNAVKFTETGGVMLRVMNGPPQPGPGHDSSPQATGASPDRHQAATLTFEVEDTGPGIAGHELQKVFEPFVQTDVGQESQEGTGLGLPISRQFVHLMGGDLSVASELGKGSVFRFQVHAQVVPGMYAEARSSTHRVVGLAPGQPTYRLLVVDDKETNRQLLVQMLVPLGFEVREAANGQEAIEQWESWQPHLIWMDMRMPVMDGYEATRYIKASTRGQATVIIALTASALEEDRAVILSEGCDDYMRKPFRESEFYGVLAKHLGVQFIYEDGAPSATQGPPSSPESAVSGQDERLASLLPGLSGDWAGSLRQAVIRANQDQMLALVDQLGQHDTALASELNSWVHDFEYKRLLALLDSIGETS